MSNNFEALQAVIAANRAIQAEARQLNIRAGKEVFPVMRNEQWKEWLASRIGEAISPSNLTDIEALRLPPLDPELIRWVEEVSPSTIKVLGVDVPVVYREPRYGVGAFPQVILGEEFLRDHKWINLPDEGVRLPDGRAVDLSIQRGDYIIAQSPNAGIFKGTLKRRFDEEQWEAFNRPAMDVPAKIDEATVLPEITTAVYGKCVLTDEDLVAFGTLEYNQNRWYERDPLFVTKWYRNRSDAEAMFRTAKTMMEKVKAEAREQAQFLALKKEAETLKARIESLFKIHCVGGGRPKISKGLLDRLSEVHFERYSFHAQVQIRAWIAEANAVIAAVAAEVRRNDPGDPRESEVDKPAEPVSENTSMASRLADHWGGRFKK